MENLHTNIMLNIISEGVTLENADESLFQPYEQFMDFKGTSYDLCYFYFLEQRHLSLFLQQLKDYSREHFPGIPVYGIYVENTLVIFFQTFQKNYDHFEHFYHSIRLPDASVEIEYRRTVFSNLTELLLNILGKVKRYGTIYCISNFHIIQTCNYKNMIQQVEELALSISNSSPQTYSQEVTELMAILKNVQNPEFLKQLAANLLIKFSAALPSCQPIVATEFLLELNQQPDILQVRTMVLNKLEEIFEEAAVPNIKSSDFTERILDYVEHHLSNPNLTLKWIAEQVGCGNNPQYFSQIFKKKTGMTPSTYAQKMNGGI